MEFRVFFPLLNRSLGSVEFPCLAPADLAKYANLVENLVANNAHTPEIRMDSYFLGKPYFGLKYRHGEKLEIKVRDKIILKGVERWTKTKFGKKKIGHYTADILELLKRNGYNVDASDPDLAFEHQVSVEKSRHIFDHNDVMVEVCQLKIPHEQPDFNGTIANDRWVSVAVEGSQESIENFLASQEDPCNFKATIRSVGELLAPNLDAAAAAGVVPVVSGYPMFVRYLAGRHSAEELSAEIVPTWLALVQRIGV